MKLIKQQGGKSIAVYDPSQIKKKKAAKKLVSEDRVNFVCPADYSQDSELFKVVTTIIDKIAIDYNFKKLIELHKKK